MNLDSSSSSSSDCQSQWTSSSTYSNNISNLIDSADAPLEVSQQKIKVRRSTRRRTLAPIYNTQINVSANDNDNDNDDNDAADRCTNTNTGTPTSPGHNSTSSSVKRARNNPESMNHDNDNDNDASQEDHHQISSQSMSMDKKLSARTNTSINACNSNDNANANDNDNANSTPPKQKRARKNQRRRSLAVQDGQMLLGPASSGSSSAHTMSSLSHVSSSGFSSFSAMEVQSSALMSCTRSDGISILSSCDKKIQTNKNSTNDDDDDTEEEGQPRLHLDTIDNCDASVMTTMTGNVSEGTSSTLSKICNGVAAMMGAHDEPSTKVGIEKKEARKRRKKAPSTPAPTRRSARIRKSIVASKVTSASKSAQTSPPDAILADVATHESCSDEQETLVKFRLSTLSPKKDKIDAKNHAAATATATATATSEEENNTHVVIGSFGDNHDVSKEQPPLKNSRKPKRRRRSSLGLHVGGLVSLKDIEAMQKEATTRRKLKTARGLQSSQVVEAENNASVNDDTETDDANPDGNVNVNVNVKKPTAEDEKVDFSVVHSLQNEKQKVVDKAVPSHVNVDVNVNVKKPTAEDKKVDSSVVHSLQNGKQKVVDEAVPSPCSIVCSEGETVPQSEEHFHVSSEAIQTTMKDVFNALEFDSKVCTIKPPMTS